MIAHHDFVDRLRKLIAHHQGRTDEKISVAGAAKTIGVPETTLRSTLEGRYPRTEEYWRKLCTGLGTSLDWIVFGRGEAPYEMEDTPAPILFVAKGVEVSRVVKVHLQGRDAEWAFTAKEALRLVRQRRYERVFLFDSVDWEPGELEALNKIRSLPLIEAFQNGTPLSDEVKSIADNVVRDVPELITVLKTIGQ